MNCSYFYILLRLPLYLNCSRMETISVYFCVVCYSFYFSGCFASSIYQRENLISLNSFIKTCFCQRLKNTLMILNFQVSFVCFIIEFTFSMIVCFSLIFLLPEFNLFLDLSSWGFNRPIVLPILFPLRWINYGLRLCFLLNFSLWNHHCRYYRN